MWNEIINKSALHEFMEKMNYFHDSCIKEVKYLSGAYVDEDLAMYPVNDCRILRMIVQRQYKNNSMIELQFEGVKCFKLFPQYDNTCEIYEATMIMNDAGIFWCDEGKLVESDLENYQGTLVCASKVKWRTINDSMGNKEFFINIK